MPSRVLLLHGPNLNLLLDLPELDAMLEESAEKLGIELTTFQANSEGALIDALHAERTRISGVIVNAGRLAPTAEILAEAIELVKRPCIEVITDGSLKARSVLKRVVLKQTGGRDAYPAALEAIAAEVRSNQLRPTGTMMPVAGPGMTVSDEITGEIHKDDVGVKKTLGRKPPAGRGGGGGAESGTKKTLGRIDGTMKISADAQALSREIVRAKIGERLSGKLSPAGLATWARSQWQQMQRGAPVESGQRERLEDVLQTLLLTASSKANDHQLIELMTQLG